MKQLLLLTKTLLVATVLLMGGAISAWAQELTAVTTETAWDFSTLSFTSSAEGQFLQDNTIYIGANITRDGTNGRTQFTSNYSTTVTGLGANIIAIKTGAAGQVIMKISSFNGAILVSDGTNVTTYGSGGTYHGGSLSYLKAAFDAEANTTYYIYTNKDGVAASNNVGIFQIFYYPSANTTSALSTTEQVTKDFTLYPRLTNKAPDAESDASISYKGITYNNVYMGNGVIYNNKSGKERMLMGAVATGPAPTNNCISFKLPKGKGTLTIKPSCYEAAVCLSNGTSVVKSDFAHGTDNVYNYESESETTFYYYATTYKESQNTGIFYLIWTPTTYDYTINAVDGNGALLQELGSGKAMEGYTYSLTGLPKVVVKDGKYYVLNDGTVTNYATQSYTMGTEDETKSITYTEDASIVYFSELEDLSSTSEKTGDYSGGKGSAIKSGGISSITTLPAGKYVATGAFCNDEKNRGMYLRTSNSKTDDNIIVYTGGSYWTGEHSTDEFTLDASTAIYLTGFTGTGSSVNQSATLDYIIIRRSSVSATISSYGWATFSSDYPLDFTSVSDLEAYTITGHEGNVVTKTKVTGTVPAGTGLLLKGAAGNYNIPVVASSSTDVSGNKLVAGTGTAISKEENKTKYVLGVSDNGTAGDTSDDFAEFQKIDGTAATVDKGKAYLLFDGENLARNMRFADDITGINEAKVEAVAQKKGKFIVEGKLVIFKNGKKYNAAGQLIY